MRPLRRFAGVRACLLGLASAALAAAPALAATGPAGSSQFSISDANGSALLLHARPGQIVHGSVSVHNLRDVPTTVLLTPSDIQTAGNGNAFYATGRLTQAGMWLHLDEQTVALAPRATRRVGFVVAVPSAARGASHYAGIVAVDESNLRIAASHERLRHRLFRFYRINREALPLTIRLPGRLSRGVALGSLGLSVQPSGAFLRLRLQPLGSELTEGARIQLRVLAGNHVVFRSASSIGQLFPGSDLSYRIPWVGRPSAGRYVVTGVIRPIGAAPVRFDRTVTVTPARISRLQRETPPAGPVFKSATPAWIWLVLVIGGGLLVCLLLAVWRLSRSRTVSGAA